MSFGLNPLLKQDHPEQAVQNHIQLSFEELQGRILHNLCEESVSVLSHLHIKEIFPDIQR